MKQIIRWSLAVCLCMLMAGCGQKTESEVLLTAEAERIAYEESGLPDAFAVAEDGTLYTVEGEFPVDAEASYTQTICAYTLDGELLYKMELLFGSGTVGALAADETYLYAANVVYTLTGQRNTEIRRISLESWEVEEVAVIEDVYSVRKIELTDNVLYYFGVWAQAGEKEYDVYPGTELYAYSGEIVGSVALDGNNEQQILPVEFPISFAATRRNSLLVYVYNEDNGFGFVEYDLKEETLNEVAWRDHGTTMKFDVCGTETDYVYYKLESVLTHVDMETGAESELADKINTSASPHYIGGFVFFRNETIGAVERVGLANMAENPTISFLTTSTMELPFGCGYGMMTTQLTEEEFALKVLALDKDFDLCMLSSRNGISYNLKENGNFYPLNEVPGVTEYLDACFPYIKEAAMKEDGTVWMLPVSVTIPGIVYNRDCWEAYGLTAPEEQSFAEFMATATQAHCTESITSYGNPYNLVETFFMEYLSCQTSFDTAEFREMAAEVKEMFILSQAWYRNTDLLRQIGKYGNLEFLYISELYRDSYIWYNTYVSDAEEIQVAGIPKMYEESKNYGTCIFLAVNPQSEHLEEVLEYITEYTFYALEQKDTLLFADKNYYTDTPYMWEVYDLYADGAIAFEMDDEIYKEPFYKYVNDELTLEKMISEAEYKRKVFLGE